MAVKRIHNILVEDDVDPEQRLPFLQHFAEEWKMLRGLRHPFIVQFLGVYEPHARSPSLVMELMDMSLQRRYQRTPYLSQSETVRLTGEVLCALVYLHARGIVHRDLTTNNVLLTRGPEPTAKISDLGVAKAIYGDDPRRRVEVTRTRAAGMTRAPGALLYMSPESLDESGRPYDTKHDVFAYGALVLATCVRHEPRCFEEPRENRRQVRERSSCSRSRTTPRYGSRASPARARPCASCRSRSARRLFSKSACARPSRRLTTVRGSRYASRPVPALGRIRLCLNDIGPRVGLSSYFVMP